MNAYGYGFSALTLPGQGELRNKENVFASLRARKTRQARKDRSKASPSVNSGKILPKSYETGERFGHHLAYLAVFAFLALLLSRVFRQDPVSPDLASRPSRASVQPHRQVPKVVLFFPICVLYYLVSQT